MQLKSVNQIHKEFISEDYPETTFKEWYDHNLKLYNVDKAEGYPNDFKVWLNSRYHNLGPKLKAMKNEQKLNGIGNVGNALSNLGQTASNIGSALGGGQTNAPATEEPKPEKKVNYVPYIIGGLAFVGVVIGVVAMVKSDKK